MPKVSLRKSVLARRSALTEPERAAASEVIQKSFIALPEYAAAKSVALYVAFRDEVATQDVIRHALQSGKELLLPAVAGDALEFRRLTCERDLAAGRFGIPEPVSGLAAVESEFIDLIVVPGVAFDHCGQRIGYGKGYYDRVLHKLEGSGRLTAFCFECQLLDRVPGEPHDVRMDRIITERRILTPGC